MYRFGAFQLDVASRELRRGAEILHLEPQAFDVLAYLVEHRDRVVAKFELMDQVWGHQFLSEANLTTRVKEIRRAFGDDGRQQHTIQNVRGRGYRFVGALGSDEGAGPRTRVGGVRLIGRADDAEAIGAALGDTSVVTVVGPGGVGKTTLAIEVCAGLASEYADGSHVVEFAGLARDEPVLPALSRALGIVFDADAPGAAISSIAIRHALIVLDNCEHVVDAVAELARKISHVPGRRAHLLVTSQVRLGLSDEFVVKLAPLNRAEATALFRARAAAVAPETNLANIDDDRIGELVSALDRLPLTVEMAAARVATMTFDDLERSLQDGTAVAYMTHRSPARRHRSLESLVTWSVEQLDASARETFIRFAVFAHAVSVSDIAAVISNAQPGRLGFELAVLADHSLLVADVRGSETRYSMLTTVRTVASEWFAARPEADDLRRRHAEYFADQLRAIDADLRTSQEIDARRRLDRIVHEIRLAFRWAQQHNIALASRMNESILYAVSSSLWFEPATWAQELLDEHSQDQRSDLLGARLVVAAAAAHRGVLREARRHAEIVVDAGSDRLRAMAIEILADIAMYEGDLESVLRHAETLGALAASLSDAHAATFAATDIALARTYLGDAHGAMAVLDAVRLDDIAPSDQAWLWYARGEALSAVGDERARDAFHEAISVATPVGNHFVISVSHVALAAEFARVGDARHAFQTFATSLRQSILHGNLTHAITASRNLVRLLAEAGDHHGAVVLAGAMAHDQIRGSYGAEATKLAAVLDAAEVEVGAEAYAQWFAQGRSLEPPEAVQAAAAMAERHAAAASDHPHDSLK